MVATTVGDRGCGVNEQSSGSELSWILACPSTKPLTEPAYASGRACGVGQGDYCLTNPDDSVVFNLEFLYKKHSAIDIVAFIHDDVTVHEPNWGARILAEFADPRVAIVGMGGAVGIGTPDIYKRPYHISQLQRVGYRSNQRDWEVHGGHLDGAMDAAVVDGFFMAIRTSFLKEIDGWAGFPHAFHMYDAYVCLQAIKRGYKVRAVGIDVTHHGGGTSTSTAYAESCRARGTTMEREHSEPHVFIYNHFRDLLPLQVDQ